MATKQPKPGGPAVFDPWTASLEESAALPMDLDDPRSLIRQYLAAQHLNTRRQAIEKGTGLDVLDAMATCARHGLSIPAWLAALYLPRFKAVAQYRVASWDADEAFGRPHPKGVHLARLRKDRSAAPMVRYWVNKILQEDPTRAFDLSMFEDVAARFGQHQGLGRSECMRIFYEHRAGASDGNERKSRRRPNTAKS